MACSKGLHIKWSEFLGFYNEIGGFPTNLGGGHELGGAAVDELAPVLRGGAHTAKQYTKCIILCINV